MAQWISGSTRRVHRVYWGVKSTSKYKYALYVYSSDRLVKHNAVLYGTKNPRTNGG